MDYIVPETNQTLSRLADLGVNVYGIPSEHTKDQRLQLIREIESLETDPVDYSLRLVDILDRCESELHNKVVRISELADELMHDY